MTILYGWYRMLLTFLWKWINTIILSANAISCIFSSEYLAVFSAYIAFFSIVNSVTRERFQWFECSTVLNVSKKKVNGIEVVLRFFTSRNFSWFLCHMPISPSTWILYGTLPRCFATVPAVQLWPGRKSRTKRGSPTSKAAYLSKFSGLLDDALGSISWLIDQWNLKISRHGHSIADGRNGT